MPPIPRSRLASIWYTTSDTTYSPLLPPQSARDGPLPRSLFSKPVVTEENAKEFVEGMVGKGKPRRPSLWGLAPLTPHSGSTSWGLSWGRTGVIDPGLCTDVLSLRDQPTLHIRCPLHLTEIFPDWFLCPIGAKRAGGLVWCASLLPAGVDARMRKSTHPCVSSVAELLDGPGSLLAESWVLSSFPFSSFPQSNLVVCSACLTLLVSSSRSSGCFTRISGRGLDPPPSPFPPSPPQTLLCEGASHPHHLSFLPVCLLPSC